MRLLRRMARAAFFDLDKTLISRNSATLWIRFELAAGRVTRWQALQALAYVVATASVRRTWRT